MLHIGDHDPSGAHLFLALAEDVQAFAIELGGVIEFSRLAVTPQQIDRLRLVTAPPKATDRAPSTARPVRPKRFRPTCSLQSYATQSKLGSTARRSSVCSSARNKYAPVCRSFAHYATTMFFPHFVGDVEA